MIETTLTKKALDIATKAHYGQIDKAGVDYIEHPLYVANQMDDEISIITALLHDVVEDSSITFSDLESEFNKDIIDALKLLTHDNNISYMDYIKRIKNNNLAKKVKIADLKHNLDENRIPNKSTKDYERIDKYKKALAYLEQ